MLLYVLFLISANFVKAQDIETENIATFTKIWGFLKYHHPKVASGELDWDKEFMTRLKEVSQLNSIEERSNYYLNWINNLGNIKEKKVKTNWQDTFMLNYDFAWLTNDKIFSEKLIQKLKYIKAHNNQGINYYVSVLENAGNTNYSNEKPYKDSIFPTVALRMLGLSRYWNIVNYFFPYKYQMNQNWNSVLTEMIPKFQYSKDTLAYHLAMAELVAKINDSHANLSTPITQKYFGLKSVPFRFKIIDNKAVVTDFRNDTLCKLNDISIGDVFLKVNGEDISTIVERQKKYLGASTDAVILRNMYNVIFNGNSENVTVTFERDGVIQEKKIHRYDFKNLSPYKHTKSKYGTWEMLEDSVGYVHVGLLEQNRVEKVIGKVKNSKAIVFDIRNYPNGTLYTIALFLNKDVTPFVKVTTPSLSTPSLFNWTPPIHCGEKNSDYYKGLVVLLVDENTQSHAEFTTMALQTAPNVVCIGSQTSGADGDVSSIVFPGGYKCYMTGIGIFYPDGKITQRIGIIPDIEVKLTIKGIKEGRDEVLEKALEVIAERTKG